jgi:hypothetical protein
LRRKIEALMVPDDVRVVLPPNGLAERERHRRQAEAQLLRSLTNGLPSRTNVCTRRKRTCVLHTGGRVLTRLCHSMTKFAALHGNVIGTAW